MKDLYLKVYLTNLKKYNEAQLIGGWVDVSTDTDWNEELKNFCRIGIGKDEIFGEEYFISDYETNINDLNISEYTSISELKNIAEFIEYVNFNDLQDIANELIEAIGDMDIDRLTELLENKKYVYIADVGDDEELGEYIVENDSAYSGLSDDIKHYLDKEAIGSDYCINNGGIYQNGNYIELLG